MRSCWSTSDQPHSAARGPGPTAPELHLEQDRSGQTGLGACVHSGVHFRMTLNHSIVVWSTGETGSDVALQFNGVTRVICLKHSKYDVN